MAHRFFCGFILFSFSFLSFTARAEESRDWSGKISEGTGFFQTSGGVLQTHQYSRLFVQNHNDLTEGLSLVLEGEADQQTSSSPLGPSWPFSARTNLVNLEAVDPSGFANSRYFSARMDRVYLKWASGPWEITAGLLRPEWGIASFYKPTDYFDPVTPLAWMKETALGSEGAEVSCFLFDDLSLEGSARWLSGGQGEWVARFVNKGIGLSLTPSFASLVGRNGIGMELSGTFPDLQARFEGVQWFPLVGPARLEWTAGLSAVAQGTQWTLEFFQDATGEALGGISSGAGNGTYFFASAEREFTAQWRFAPALVKAVEGGPFLFWPRVTWRFETSWLLEFQAHLPLGSDPGPLALNPGRAGFSMTYLF